MTALSPKYQLLHYARMSAINDTTPTHAQSHGSDHLSLVSSFGADNEEQIQFAKFQGRRWVSKRGPCLLELPWLAKSPRLIPAARVRLTNPRDLTDRLRRVRDLGLHMPDATHRAFRNWVDRACQFQRVSKEKQRLLQTTDATWTPQPCRTRHRAGLFDRGLH